MSAAMMNTAGAGMQVFGFSSKVKSDDPNASPTMAPIFSMFRHGLCSDSARTKRRSLL